MKFRTTLVLLIVALGLAGWIAIYERGDTSRTVANAAGGVGKLLVSFDPAGIDRIVIETGETTTELQRHAIYWIFKKPITDRASALTVSAALDQLGHLNIVDELRPGELLNSPELSDEALGFGTPDAIRVRLFTSPETDPDSAPDKKATESDDEKADAAANDREIAVLVMGNPAPLSNSLYARIESDPSRAALTYVVSGGPRQYFSDPVAILRDRSLIGVPTDQIVGVTVRTAGGDVEVGRRIVSPQTGWTMVRPLQTRADASMMEDFLARLSGLQISGVATESAPSSALPNQIPTGAARIDLMVNGWDRPLSLYIAEKSAAAGSDSTAPTANDPQAPWLTAQVSTRPGVYDLRSGLLADLPDTAAEFRDPYLARIPVQLLHRITIASRNGPNFMLFYERFPQGGGEWWVSPSPGVKERANRERIKRLLNAINGGRVLEFLNAEPAELEKYGMRSPELQIAFDMHAPKFNEDGSVVVENGATPRTTQRILQFGRTDDENTLYANFVNEPWVYKIDPAIRSAIPSHPLKWRDLKVLNFNLIGLRSIERSGGSDSGIDKVMLDYEYTADRWQATADDTDATVRLDPSKAMTLARTLGSLEAVDWITNLQTAYQLLDEQPSMEITVTRREIDPLTNSMKPVADHLRFAKAPGVGYYGQIVGSPNVFLLSADIYRDLTQPLLAP